MSAWEGKCCFNKVEGEKKHRSIKNNAKHDIANTLNPQLLNTIQQVNKVGVAGRLSVAEAGWKENYWELDGTKDVNLIVHCTFTVIPLLCCDLGDPPFLLFIFEIVWHLNRNLPVVNSTGEGYIKMLRCSNNRHFLNWITTINHLLHDVLIYWGVPVHCL